MCALMKDAGARIGQTVGDYRLTAVLGEGGMGVVFAAEHVTLGRRAAVKVLHAEFAARQEFIQRFFQEARAVCQIRHPSIVDVTEFAHTPEGEAYLVMEYLEGESLAHRFARTGAMPLAFVARLVHRVASPLAATHRQRIVHRDLKPDNIFLSPDPDLPDDFRVKLIDFGVAKLYEQDAAQELRTATGTLLGTPRYMSPEQCRGARDVDARTDIYALGVIAYELLAGRPPLTADTLGEMLLAQQTETPPPLNLPPEHAAINEVLACALAKDPAARFDSVSAFANAFCHAAGVELERARPLVERHSAEAMPPTVAPALAPTVPAAYAPAASTPLPPTAAAVPVTIGAPPRRSWAPLFALAGVAVLALLVAAGGGIYLLTKEARKPDKTAAAADPDDDEDDDDDDDETAPSKPDMKLPAMAPCYGKWRGKLEDRRFRGKIRMELTAITKPSVKDTRGGKCGWTRENWGRDGTCRGRLTRCFFDQQKGEGVATIVPFSKIEDCDRCKATLTCKDGQLGYRRREGRVRAQAVDLAREEEKDPGQKPRKRPSHNHK